MNYSFWSLSNIVCHLHETGRASSSVVTKHTLQCIVSSSKNGLCPTVDKQQQQRGMLENASKRGSPDSLFLSASQPRWQLGSMCLLIWQPRHEHHFLGTSTSERIVAIINDNKIKRNVTLEKPCVRSTSRELGRKKTFFFS